MLLKLASKVELDEAQEMVHDLILKGYQAYLEICDVDPDLRDVFVENVTLGE